MSDLLTDIRDTLADQNGDRWSDDVLIRLLNRGIEDFLRYTKAYKETIYIEIVENEPTYDLSGRFLDIVRVQYNDEFIPLVSTEDLDNACISWRSDSGQVTHAAYNIGKPAILTLYPIPEVGNSMVITQNSPYGIITDLTYNEETIDIITDLSTYNIGDYFSVLGTIKSRIITSKNDEFPLDETWRSIIDSYVIGKALRADMDAQNRQFGAEELGIYQAKAKEIKKSVAKAYTNNATLETHYRRT